MQLALTLLLGGLALLGLALADKAVRALPLTPALIYLLLGYLLGWAFGAAPDMAAWQPKAPAFTLAFELAVLVSLVAVGLRLQLARRWQGWRAALVLAGPTMAVFIALAAATAVLLLGVPWPVALLLASVLAPTDPILASEVQIRSEQDRDTVRVALSAEGGLNDGTALPAVMAALALMGLQDGRAWWWHQLLWPIGGGAAIGLLLSALLGAALRRRAAAGDGLPRHELLYAGLVVLSLGLAHATATSSFVVSFVAAASLSMPAVGAAGEDLGQRLQGFGGSIERLVEAVAVTAIGVALHGVPLEPVHVLMALPPVLLLRPLSLLLVGPRHGLSRTQRRLVGWFGIRGIGSLYYLSLAFEHALDAPTARLLGTVTLLAIAASILLHGLSATPLMRAYRQRRRPAAP
jgi:NhaP-type Na+/H+ or K+/H+ antiporter